MLRKECATLNCFDLAFERETVSITGLREINVATHPARWTTPARTWTVAPGPEATHRTGGVVIHFPN